VFFKTTAVDINPELKNYIDNVVNIELVIQPIEIFFFRKCDFIFAKNLIVFLPPKKFQEIIVFHPWGGIPLFFFSFFDLENLHISNLRGQNLDLAVEVIDSYFIRTACENLRIGSAIFPLSLIPRCLEETTPGMAYYQRRF
jgi:hypothetical protein